MLPIDFQAKMEIPVKMHKEGHTDDFKGRETNTTETIISGRVDESDCCCPDGGHSFSLHELAGR